MRPPRKPLLVWRFVPVWRTALATLALTALLAVLACWMVIRKGWYDAGAVDQHWQPVYSVLELALRYSARHQARDITPPALTPTMARQGALVYARHCVQCHGAPGVAPGLASLAMQPSPGPLVHMTRRWQPNELYWIVSNGVKMTGMPAWRFHLSEQEIWSVVALLGQLPHLSPAQGVVLFGQAQTLERPQPPQPPQLPQPPQPAPAPMPAPQFKPDPERGRIALSQYACQSCHVIPGVAGSRVEVGPPLTDLFLRRYVAGYLPAGEDNLVRWIRYPTQVKPGTAMPALGVSERDARDMARWLLGGRAR